MSCISPKIPPRAHRKSTDQMSCHENWHFWAAELFLLCFEKYSLTLKHVGTWFISALPSVSFTQESAHWMRQPFISQLQHLFRTYSPPIPCSLVGSRSIYSEIILSPTKTVGRHTVLDPPLANQPLHTAHLLSEVTNCIFCRHNHFLSNALIIYLNGHS